MKFLYPIILSAPFVLAGCGSSSSSSDTTAPSAISSYTSDSILAAQEAITVTFTESIDTASIALVSDKIDANSITLEWNDDHSILTMTPVTHWPAGGSELSLSFSDTSGNASDMPLLLELNAILTFSAMQSANVIIDSFEVDGETTSFSSLYGNPAVTDDTLWLADYGEGAIYKFNGVPTASENNTAEAITSIEYTSDEGALVNYYMSGPQTPFVYNNQLMFVDYGNKTVGLFNGLPVSGQDNSGIVLGLNADTNCSSNGFDSPEALIAADNKLLVADSGNNRVLIWNTIPTSSSDAPDLVLGQNDFTSCENDDDNQDGESDAQVSARTLSYPSGVWTDGEKLIVADNNNRILIWNSFPTENFMEADIVLGQPDFSSNTSNNDVDDDNNQVASARTLNSLARGVYSNGKQIFVADYSNHRVLIWNTWPTENFAAADALLGQSTFSEVNENNGQGTALDSVFYGPNGITINDDQVIVSDSNNNRVMIFDSL